MDTRYLNSGYFGFEFFDNLDFYSDIGFHENLSGKLQDPEGFIEKTIRVFFESAHTVDLTVLFVQQKPLDLPTSSELVETSK